MVRIDCLIFGYRKLKIDPADLSSVTSVLLRSSIPSRINSDGTLTVRERDFEKIKTLFSGRIDFEHSEPLGLAGKYKLLPHKAAYLSALVVSLALVLLLSSIVWDVRVEGNENIPDSEIRLGLSECGFSVGNLWPMLNRSKIEAIYLEKEKRISWINLNRRGSVAYVTVIENDEEEEKEEDRYEYSNIISGCDCVIEEITVKRGTAAVKPGDVVKKGDVLIIGVLPEEAGGGFCSAEGSVIGRISDKITVEADRNYEKTVAKNKRVYSVTLNFFKFSLNIFKLYGNLTNKCVIIETEKTYSLFGRCKLPFSVSIKYIPEYITEEAVYSDEELVQIASSRLDALTAARLSTSDLLRIRSYGEFTDNGYVISSDIVFLSEVSQTTEFRIE